MKKLVIAEKPSVGKDIAKVLGAKAGGGGYLEGSGYIVTWALGHLVTLQDPDEYHKKYKNWSLEHLPIIPDKMQLKVIPQSSKQYKVVKEQLFRKDVGEIIIATDAGREGELVARWILDKTGIKKPIKRLWISSVTDKAIADGFKNLKDGKEYLNLYDSARSRAYADWLVGINASRGLTTKFNASLSCGRVQTPTLAIILKRELDIRNFKPKDYYGANLIIDKVTFTWQDKKTGSTRTFDPSFIEELIANCTNKGAKIENIQGQAKKTYVGGLYDLTTLQRDANRLFNFSASKTLDYMQTLYERHKVLTYPRTNSKFLSKDIVPTLPERLRAISIGEYKKYVVPLLKDKIKSSSSFVDDTKVTDHHAIIPTEVSPDFSDFSEGERKIYDLVVKRFLAVLYPPFEYEETKIMATVNGYNFVAKGKRIINMGFKEIYSKYQDEDDEENKTKDSDLKDQRLPAYKKGDMLKGVFRGTTGKTKPPTAFTEGTLLGAMENPAAFMDDVNKTLAKTLSDAGGIGTVATRGDIIEKLFNGFLIEPRGNYLYTTAKGRQLLELVPKDLRSPTLTAEWEQKLEKISKGNLTKDTFLNEIKKYTREVIKEISASDKIYKHDNITNKKCPNCEKLMLEVVGKKGKYLICQDRDCNTREQLEQITNARCPKCFKKLSLIGAKEKTFVCPCGHKEKEEAFTKRREKERNVPSKNELQRYIKQVNKDEKPAINNKLLSELSKLSNLK